MSLRERTKAIWNDCKLENTEVVERSDRSKMICVYLKENVGADGDPMFLGTSNVSE
jgi:hypothetical protein